MPEQYKSYNSDAIYGNDQNDKRAKMALYRSPDQINWPFGSGEEVQNRFPRERPWHHLGYLIGLILALFYLQVTDASYQVWSQLAFRFRRRSEKRFLRWQP